MSSVWENGGVDCDASCLFQAEDGIRDLVRSRGLGDVYKRQVRDMGRELGKKIEVIIQGAETELDKTIIEAVKDLSLIHIWRCRRAI